MIVFDEKIVGVWYLVTILDKQDWLAAVREIEPDAKYELIYRFRYYKDDKAWDSADKKNWYKGELTGTRNYVVMSLRSVAKRLESVSVAGIPLYELLNENDIDKFMREFQDAPFVMAKMLSNEEMAKEMAKEGLL
jgi:hypothetical protein